MAVLVPTWSFRTISSSSLSYNSTVVHAVQESERLLGTVLSIQPRTTSAAGGTSNDDLVANMARDILAGLSAPLSREDASIAKDPFAPLPTGHFLHSSFIS